MHGSCSFSFAGAEGCSWPLVAAIGPSAPVAAASEVAFAAGESTRWMFQTLGTYSSLGSAVVVESSISDYTVEAVARAKVAN